LKRKINPNRWYTAREAAALIGGITELTVKARCRKKTLKGKQMGTLMAWHVQGREIMRFRKTWNLDS
jgi:hypothetical protein